MSDGRMAAVLTNDVSISVVVLSVTQYPEIWKNKALKKIYIICYIKGYQNMIRRGLAKFHFLRILAYTVSNTIDGIFMIIA